MKLLAYVRSLAAKFLHRSETENDLEEELRSHVQHRADDLERCGLSPDEALRRARMEFGGHEKFKEESRAALGGEFFETLIRDVRFGVRVLRKSPGFSVLAVLTLALGIGAVAVIFSVVDNALLHPFPYRDADGICDFHIHNLDRAGEIGRLILSVPEFLDHAR